MSFLRTIVFAFPDRRLSRSAYGWRLLSRFSRIADLSFALF